MKSVGMDLPRSPESVATARHVVDSRTSVLTTRQRENAALMVSELVTNALQHGVGRISLRIDTEANGLRIEVSDEGNVAVSPSPIPGAHGGWGLRIVEQLADDWGVIEGSTRVWFRLAAAPE